MSSLVHPTSLFIVYTFSLKINEQIVISPFLPHTQKSTKQEVGEESKLARSFDRIRSIVRKKRNKEKNENDTNTKLEQLVNEVIIRRRTEKKMFVVDQKLFTTLEIPQTNLYRHSYQVELKTM